jgi:hypothetical protein
MVVINPSVLERIGQGFLIELGVVTGPRHSPDVHHPPNIVGLEEVYQLLQTAIGVADG